MVNKIFGIGFQKTGTTTLRSAFEALGYSVKGGGRDLVKPLQKGDLIPVYKVVDQYDSFEDHPWPLLYRDLDKKYPDSKFILTIRDDDKWLKSVVNHLGFLPDEMQTLTYGVGFPVGYEDVFLNKYQQHNQEVLEYFKDRPQDLLVVNWEDNDGWENLCAFLDNDIPDMPFPHERKGVYGKRTDFVKKFIGATIRKFRK